MFAHETLQVYDKARRFAARVFAWTNLLEKKHSFVDHLSRAAESIMLNLAEAARHRIATNKLSFADYAIGSSLECAACFDVARIRKALEPWQCHQDKQIVCEITRMLIGLRKTWDNFKTREEAPEYESNVPKGSHLFHHESLDVYRTALSFMQWFVTLSETAPFAERMIRRIDEIGTSIVLNIAEGNGRYAHVDHHRFLLLAQSSAVKAAVYLDLSVDKSLIPEADAEVGKKLLRRIDSMIAAF